MKTVLLVDDDAAVCRSLSRALREEGWQVETFLSAEAFLARPEPRDQGCLVLDVSMPGLDGLALQRQLCDTGQHLPIVFLSGNGDIPMSVQAIKAGAGDFLTKPVTTEKLLSAVRAAIAQHQERANGRERLASLSQRFSGLTPREREVLQAIARGKLNKQIAGDLGIVEQTVKFHRAHIMERMQARTVAELMHMAAQLQIGIH